MHELALMESLVDAVETQASGERVTTVRLEVGRLTCVVPDALRFCFDVCTRSTRLEHASLEIFEIPGRGRCRACGEEVAVDGPYGICPCGSVDVALIGGRELRIRNVEVV